MTSVEKTTADMSNLTVSEDVNSDSDRKILIAVDFGTTFSGVAWAQTRRVSSSQQRDLYLLHREADVFHSQMCRPLSSSGRMPPAVAWKV